ncbi:protein NO VEIN domain-containing protein, partial [Escherichia coli]
GVGSSFLVSHNELEFSKEAGDQFHLYRVFQFRDGPRLFTLPGTSANMCISSRRALLQIVGGDKLIIPFC